MNKQKGLATSSNNIYSYVVHDLLCNNSLCMGQLSL